MTPGMIRGISFCLGISLFPSLALATVSPKAPAPKKPSSASSRNLSQSIKLVRISDHKVLFEENPMQLLSPASITKLITTAAVLTRFSPFATFTTRFYRRGSMQNGIVKGDLIVVGDGDPMLVSEKLWQIAADFKSLGIREFTGNLVLDNSLFAGDARDESREEGEDSSRNAYDAPITAFGVNFNTLSLAIAPNERIGLPAHVNFYPYALDSAVQVVSQTKTAQQGAHTSLSVSRNSLKDGKSQLLASGNIPIGSSLQKVYRSTNDPVLTSGEILKAFLKAQGVVIRGGIKDGVLPKEDAVLILESESDSVSRMVQGQNLYSNNYIADVLVKRLGAAFPHDGKALSPHSGSYANGIWAISEFLHKDVGIHEPFVLENGSGLDPKNRISADAMSKMLVYVAEHFSIFPEFLASLPSSGQSGTLEKRFEEREDLTGIVRAKTGSLSTPIAVSTLAGYLYHPKHGLCAFAILQNGIEGKPQPDLESLHKTQEEFVAKLF